MKPFFRNAAVLLGALLVPSLFAQEPDPTPGTGAASSEHLPELDGDYFGTTDQIGLGAYASATTGVATTSPVLELTPDLKELARGLNHDPVKIYNYVRNEIESELYFGLKKGPRLTLLEESGNDLDKAFLLAALLQIASDADLGYSATIRIAQGLQTLPYHANDGVTPDICSLWKLDPDGMDFNPSSDPDEVYYREKTPYLHLRIGGPTDPKWSDVEWRRISAAFTYAAQVGYSNDGRMQVPPTKSALTIRRFYVKASGLPGTSGDVILDPWSVRYTRVAKATFPTGTLASPDTLVRGTVTGHNLWRPATLNDRLWYSDPSGGFEGTLKGLSAALLADFKSPSKLGVLTSDEVFGRSKMLKVFVGDLDDAAASVIPVAVGGGSFCSVNKNLSWRLNLTLDDQPSVEVYFPSLAGRRLSVHTENNLVNYFLSLGLENHLFGNDLGISEIAREPLGTTRKVAPLVSVIKAPFATTGQTSTVSYARNAEAPERLRAAHSIIYGFRPSGGLLRARQARLDEILQATEVQYPGSTTGNTIAWGSIPTREAQRPIVLETLNVQGLDWLRQTNLVRQAAGDVFGVNLGKLVSVGRMSQIGGYFIDIYQQLGATISRDGNYNEVGGEIAGLYAAMLLESALEHSIIEQASSSAQIYSGEVWRASGASTVNIFHAAHKKTLYGAPALGVLVKNAVGNNKPPSDQTTPLALLQDGYEAFFNEHQASAATRPWAPPPIALAVYQDKSAFPTGPGGTAGSAMFGGSAYLSPFTIRMTAGGANGGYSILNDPIDTSFIFESDSSKPGYFELSSALKLIDLAQPSYGLLDLFGADPVNVASGAFEHSEIDLSLGSGEAPMGLSFKRDYSSSRSRHDVAALGFGWTHNWDIRLTENTHAAAALGATIPRQMVPFVLSLHLMRDNLVPPRKAFIDTDGVAPNLSEPNYQGYYEPSINVKRWMVVNAIAKWCADQVTNNAVSVTMGSEGETFTRNPDGTYDGGSGSTMTFTMAPNGVGTLKQRHGNTIEFTGLYTANYGYRRGRATAITGPHGQAVTLTWGPKGITEVSSVAGSTRKLTFTYASNGSNHLTAVNEVVGATTNRSVAFTYSGGNLVGSTDPENLSPLQSSLSGGSTLYGYSAPPYASVGGCLSLIRDPKGQDVVRNEYDAFCRVTRQDSGIIERDGSGTLLKPWIFRYAGIYTDEVDPLGGTKTYYYDNAGRLVRQTDALGYASLNFYDAEDRVIGTVDARGARIETDYDIYHNTTAIREFRNAAAATPYTTTIQYDALHRPRFKTDPLNRITEFTYPPGSTAADPQTVIQGGKTTIYGYIASGFAKGLLATVEDDAGIAVTNTYDGQANLQTVKKNNVTTTYSNYTLAGDAQTVTDPSLITDTYTFNRRRQTISHVRVDAANPAYTLSETSLYEATGRLALEATATGRAGGSKRKAFEYLSTGKPTYTRYAGADGLLSTADDTFELKVYDEREWEVQSYDVNGNVTETNYLANGWTASSELPVDPKLGTRTVLSEYDAAGRVTKSTDVLTRDTTTAFSEHVPGTLPDGTNVVTDRATVTDPATFTTTQWKDAMGNVRATVDKRGKTYQMDYDDWDRVTKTVTPDDRTFSAAYWQDGRVAQVSKGYAGSQLVTQNLYGASNRRLSSVWWPASGKIVSYNSYDGRGNLLLATENGKTLVRTYDSFNRVRTYKNSDGWTIGYEYYNDGMLKRIYYPDSATDTNPFDNDSVLYNYDQQGRLLTITDWAGRVTTYNWRTDGRLNSITRPNGTVRQLLYDAISRVIGFTERTSAGTLIQVQRLEYRKTDDLASSFSHPAKPASGGSTPVPISSATYGDDNDISSVNGQSLTTDARGNLTSAVLDSSGTPATLAFDDRDWLTGVDAAVDTTYTYDLEGHRTSMTHAGATTNYVFDPHGGSLVRMLVRVDPTGKKTRYVYGVGLDYEVDQTTSQAKYYHYDFTGGTAAMTDQAGTVTDRFFYTPYGQVTHATGTSDTPFKFGGFLGIITDPNGLLSMRARYYSPVLSRFVSMDPAKFEGGLNWYAYASGNPLTLGDPTGFGSESTLDAIQTGLSVLGMVPVVGFAFDLVNAGISVARGDYGDAALNLFSAIPGIGDVAGSMKLGSSAFKMADMGADLGKPVSHTLGSFNTSAGLAPLSFSYSATKTTARTNFNVYETLAEVPISGATRGGHRGAANTAFARQLEGSPELRGRFNQHFGADVLGHMNSGAGGRLINPPGAVWHHPVDNPKVLQLLRRAEHTNPLLQPVLHPGPNRTGGFGTHFGGR